MDLTTLEADGAVIIAKLPAIVTDLLEIASLTELAPGTAAAELTTVLKTAAAGLTAFSTVSGDFLTHVQAIASDLQKLEVALKPQ